MSLGKLPVQAYPAKERTSGRRISVNDLSHPRSLGSGLPGHRVQSVICFASAQAESQRPYPYSPSVTAAAARPLTSGSIASRRAGFPLVRSREITSEGDHLETGRFTTSKVLQRSKQLMRPCALFGTRRDAVEILESKLPSRFVHSLHCPSTTDTYWKVVEARNSALEKVIAGVTTAYEAAYGDQIAAFSMFMISALRDGLVPHQPQATPSHWIKLLAIYMQQTVQRFYMFASLLFGFDELSPDDQRTLLVEKHLISCLWRFTCC
ncbi:uncharacterized protein LOC129588886 [Paramacrobiotus metropolitanus]|uniref:uncharacterized protein LOC129588886 n=1 Tax=Paramacrobiotus metropolitanus TaxID=2943436 RepID=UPI002445FF37|nr:uncharacterized protein LOC129588886 [Paramacrobiotus metropolitanus]